MSPVSPIQGPTPPIPAPRANPAGGRNSGPESPDFSKALRNFVDKVDGDQNASAAAIRNLLSGNNQDILSTVAEVAEADLSFKLLIGVRNKVIEAYKQTMNMQL